MNWEIDLKIEKSLYKQIYKRLNSYAMVNVEEKIPFPENISDADNEVLSIENMDEKILE